MRAIAVTIPTNKSGGFCCTLAPMGFVLQHGHIHRTHTAHVCTPLDRTLSVNRLFFGAHIRSDLVYLPSKRLHYLFLCQHFRSSQIQDQRFCIQQRKQCQANLWSSRDDLLLKEWCLEASGK